MLRLIVPGVVDCGAIRSSISAHNQYFAIREPRRGREVIGLEAISHCSVKQVGGRIVEFRRPSTAGNEDPSVYRRHNGLLELESGGFFGVNVLLDLQSASRGIQFLRNPKRKGNSA